MKLVSGGVDAVVSWKPLVNAAVTPGFGPEELHIRLLQDYGVVSGVRGTTVLVNRVSAHDVRRIARWYWVQRITTQ